MLVAAPERWDEACFALPALRALAASGLRIGVLCHAQQHQFWAAGGEFSVIDYPDRSKAKVIAKSLVGAWKASLAWEIGIAAESFKLAGIPRRLGPTERKLNKVLTHPLVVSVGPLEHRVQYYLAAIGTLGVETQRADFFLPINLGINPESAVLLAPDSDFGPNHEWLLERWLEIAQRLLGMGQSIQVAGLVGRNLGKNLAAALADRAKFFELTDLGAALPFLATHRWVISADGSLPHLASHVGATCITLFGPNDPAWKRPLGRRHAVARRHVECAPCLLPKCTMDLRCQHELTAERVWQVVSGKLSEESAFPQHPRAEEH